MQRKYKIGGRFDSIFPTQVWRFKGLAFTLQAKGLP